MGVFHETRMYKCLKGKYLSIFKYRFNPSNNSSALAEALVKKLKLSDSDETALKKIFITNFDRIKRAIRARN